MKSINMRVGEEAEKMLEDISVRPTTAANEAIEVFTWLQKATMNELKGKFTREEIVGLADSFNGLIPTWRLMVNTSVLIAHTEDAEKYQRSISMHGGNPDELIKKLSGLTTAQAAILQLELVSFWNRDEKNGSPKMDKLIEKFTE